MATIITRASKGSRLTRAELDANFTNLNAAIPTGTNTGDETADSIKIKLGYTPAPLGTDNLVPAIYLPSYVDDVVEIANYAALPVTGESGKIYVLATPYTSGGVTSAQYRWSGSAYAPIVASPGSTDAVAEGSANLYFTAARVLATVLADLSTASGGAITATDTLLAALGKIQYQINNLPSGGESSSSSLPTGSRIGYFGTTAPDGWVMASGRTIGNAASGATERANADTEALFTLLWNSMANTEAAVSSGRGASAAADYAANKTIALPDLRGRVPAGKDNMGGTTAARLTSAGSGIVGTTLGATGGTQTHTLTVAQMPLHNHSVPLGDSVGSGGASSNIVSMQGTAGNYVVTGSNGSGSAHQNTQPTIVENMLIKL